MRYQRRVEGGGCFVGDEACRPEAVLGCSFLDGLKDGRDFCDPVRGMHRDRVSELEACRSVTLPKGEVKDQPDAVSCLVAHAAVSVAS